jgi:Tfp pilus assembly protein PilW
MTRLSLQRGLTLIDVIVWISVFLVVIIALISALTSFYKTNRFAIDQADATASAQRGIDRMVRVIREASYSVQGAYPIISLSSTSMTFYADTNNDGYAERVRFFLESEALKQGVITPQVGSLTPYAGTETISVISSYVRNDVSTPLFQYYDDSGVILASYADVDDARFVVASLVVDIDPLRTPTLMTLRSSAAMRNLR